MLKNILPKRFQVAINNLDMEYGNIEEIRIRLNRQAYLVTSNGNYLLNLIATQHEMNTILEIIYENIIILLSNVLFLIDFIKFIKNLITPTNTRGMDIK